MTTNTSNSRVGAVFEQELKSQRKLNVFFSVKVSPAQSRYSTFSRELLAIYLAVRHFRHFLEGRLFTIFTDHKTLKFVKNNNSDKLISLEVRHLDYTSQFTNDLRYVKEKKTTQSPIHFRGLDFRALKLK